MTIRLWMMAILVGLMMACSSGSGDDDGGGGGGGDGGGETPVPVTDWDASSCTSVTGTSNVALTIDAGTTFFDDGSAPPFQAQYALGLVATGDNTLVASVDRNLLISRDSGCNWSLHAVVDFIGLTELTVAEDGAVFAHTREDFLLYKVADNGATTVLQLPEPLASMTYDRDDPSRLRMAGATSGRLYESLNGGTSWTEIGTDPNPGQVTYFIAFNPNNFDHMVRGTTRLLSGSNRAGVFSSTDGGTTWEQATGFNNAELNGFVGVIAPSDQDVVWLLGLDLGDPNLSARTIYRSDDGGLTFEARITGAQDVQYTNGTLIHPHPKDAERIAFSITEPANASPRFTYLYLYDGTENELSIGSFAYQDMGEIWGFAFNPDHDDNFFVTKTWQFLTKRKE